MDLVLPTNFDRVKRSNGCPLHLAVRCDLATLIGQKGQRGLPLLPQEPTFDRSAVSVAKGQSRHFAPLKNSEPFVRRTTAELVADLPIGA